MSSSSSSSSSFLLIFPKDFYKYVLEKRNIKVSLYDSGLKYLDKILYFILEEMNNTCSHKFNMTEHEVQENLLYFLEKGLETETTSIFSEAEKLRVTEQLKYAVQAGFERIDESEELANDIPEIFKRISCTKTGMQFYLSTVMEIACWILHDCTKTFTEKNITAIPMVKLINKSRSASSR